MSARRILDAVTLRRVVAFLLIGGFAKEIVSVFSWLADTALDLKDVPALRVLVLAGVQFALDVALIYLAVRALASLLDPRDRHRDAAVAEPCADEVQGPSGVAEDLEAQGSEAADRPREGGGDGRRPDHD